MIARIKVWSSRHLSFIARANLINNALVNIHMHWSQVYILPKKVLKEVNKICRAFLWSGQAYSNRPGNIAWDHLCSCKHQGGLGIRNMMLWNVANMGKYVWDVATKQDNIWIKWIHSVYLRNEEWWSYQPNINSSWYWKKICSTRDQLKQYYSQAELGAMVKYSVKTVYEKMAEARTVVQWDKFVWSRLNTPKHNFICWLAIQVKLNSTARLARFGISNMATCLICSNGTEEHEHLFFRCQYSQECLGEIKHWLNIRNTINTLQQLVQWCMHRRSSRSMYTMQVLLL